MFRQDCPLAVKPASRSLRLMVIIIIIIIITLGEILYLF
jgi:hypothetical protein